MTYEPTDEMVEKVARALLDSHQTVDTWEDIGDYWQDNYRDEARVAIAVAAPLILEQEREKTERGSLLALGLMHGSSQIVKQLEEQLARARANAAILKLGEP